MQKMNKVGNDLLGFHFENRETMQKSIQNSKFHRFNFKNSKKKIENDDYFVSKAQVIQAK